MAPSGPTTTSPSRWTTPPSSSDQVEGLTREVVAVGRGPAGGLPLAAARNLGVRTAIDAGADVVVLLDVDCLAGAGLVASYADVVTARPEHIWSGPVTYLPPRRPAATPRTRPTSRTGTTRTRRDRALRPASCWSPTTPTSSGRCPSACTRARGSASAASARTTSATAGEDTDLGRTAIARGIGLGWVGGARAYHQHHPVSSPPVEHLDDILRNGRLFHERWGEWPMTGWLEEFERRGLVRREDGHWVRETPVSSAKETTP